MYSSHSLERQCLPELRIGVLGALDNRGPRIYLELHNPEAEQHLQTKGQLGASGQTTSSLQSESHRVVQGPMHSENCSACLPLAIKGLESQTGAIIRQIQVPGY